MNKSVQNLQEIDHFSLIFSLWRLGSTIFVQMFMGQVSLHIKPVMPSFDKFF